MLFQQTEEQINKLMIFFIQACIFIVFDENKYGNKTSSAAGKDKYLQGKALFQVFPFSFFSAIVSITCSIEPEVISESFFSRLAERVL